MPWAIEVRDVPQETLRDTRGPGLETVAEMLRRAAEPSDSYAVRNVAMLRVMFDLALRVSEVVRLEVADLEPRPGAYSSFSWVLGKDSSLGSVAHIGPFGCSSVAGSWRRAGSH